MRILLAIVCVAANAASANAADGAVRAIAVGGKLCWAAGDGGLVLQSDDQGASWRAVECKAQADLRGACFTDENTGWLFGGRATPGNPSGSAEGVIVATADGGKTWKISQPPGMGFLYGGWMDGQRGIVFGQATRACRGGAWVTATGGAIWLPAHTESGGSLLGGDLSEQKDACLVGPAYRIAVVHGSEQSVIPLRDVTGDAALTAARFSGANVWVVGESAAILVGPAGATKWDIVPSPLPARTKRLADFEAVAPAGDGEAYIAGGLAGVVLRTHQRGKTIDILPGPRPGPVHALCALTGGDAPALLAGGDGGRIWRSADDAQTWKLTHGKDAVDVLFIAAPADVSFMPALATQAAAGADAAVVFAALPTLGERRADLYLQSAAAAAGAGGSLILNDFASIAGEPPADALDVDAILARWTKMLDLPARDEALRQLAAAIRLYQPKVVVIGPTDYAAIGKEYESQLVARLAGDAIKLAGDEQALEELKPLRLAAWAPKRSFTGCDGNARYAPPWRAAPPAANAGSDVMFLGWKYPSGTKTSVGMLAARGEYLLPWIGPMERAPDATSFRNQAKAQRMTLLTAGLADAHIGYEEPPFALGIATGALLKASAPTALGPGVLSGMFIKAVKEHPDDGLPADALLLLWARLLENGELTAAAEVQQALLTSGGAHPLYQRLSVAALAMAASREWAAQRAELAGNVAGIAPPMVVGVEPGQLKAGVAGLAKWKPWQEDEMGLLLLGKASAAAGDFETARRQYAELAQSADRVWSDFGAVELAGLTDAAKAVSIGGGTVLPVAAEPVVVDGRVGTGLWPKAAAVKLQPAAGAPPWDGPVTAEMIVTPAGRTTPAGLAIAIRIGPPPTTTAPAPRPIAAPTSQFTFTPLPPALPEWKLSVAVDSDRDGWTQLLLDCDSKAGRSLWLMTHLGFPAKLPADQLLVQAAKDDAGWTIEMLLPHQLLGTSPKGVELLRMQLRLTLQGAGGGSTELYLRPQSDHRPLPHRYALIVLPKTMSP